MRSLTEAVAMRQGTGVIPSRICGSCHPPSGFFHPLLERFQQVPSRNRTELRVFIEANALSLGRGAGGPYEIR